MCLHTTPIFNRKFTANKKNGGVIPAINDIRTLHVPKKCGKCKECRDAKARDWTIRLMDDIKANTNGIFITLTFSDESITELTPIIQEEAFHKIIELTTSYRKKYNTEPLNDEEAYFYAPHDTTNYNKREHMRLIRKEQNKMSGYGLDKAICTLAIRRFTERWRKKYKETIRHWLVTELGHQGTKNIHMHGILWTNNKQDIVNIWKYGYIYPRSIAEWQTNFISDRSISYMVKYINKIDKEHTQFIPKILNSKGIGKNYTISKDAQRNKYKENETKETYTTRDGHQIALPAYYRNKIYTDEEKEKLWIEKLNKEEKWIMGKKIDISNGTEEYEKALKRYQEINKILGYGTDKKDWEQEAKEEKQRSKMQQIRITRGTKRNASGGPPGE